MGKYDDAIGGGKLILDVEEVLNEESAKKVDDRIKKQKADLETPIEINVKSDKAENRLKELAKAAKQVKNDLQEAISSQKSFEEINKLVSKYELLKKQIKAVTPEVNKNNTSLKESNQILKDTKKIVDQLTVSENKLNKTRKTKKTTPVVTVGVVDGVKEAENALDSVKDKVEDVKDAYKTLNDIVEETRRSIYGTDFDDIFSVRTVEGYAAALTKVRNKMTEIKDAARDAKKEYDAYADTIVSYTGSHFGNKSTFQKAIKDAWSQGDQAMAAKLFDSYQKKFPDGKFKPEKQFGTEWSENFSKNLEEANRNLSYYRTQLKNTAEAYGTYSAFIGLQNMEKELTGYYNMALRERAEAERAAAEQANMLADAQKRFATNDVITAQKNLNAAIDEYNAKLAESNRLYEEKCRIEDLDSYENEPWYKENELPAKKIMEIARQVAEADDAVNDFKVSLKEAVRVYRELGGDMKLPFSDEGLLNEIDVPVKITPVIEGPVAAKTRSSKIKVREFAGQDAYDALQDEYREKHDGENEYLKDVIDIVPRVGKDFTRISADMTTSCKKAETAVKRFFSALDPEKYPELAEWKGFIEESMQNGMFSQSDSTGGWAWEVQALDDNTYYVSVIAVTDAIESQIEATEKLAEVQNKLDKPKSTMSYTESSKWSSFAEYKLIRNKEDQKYLEEHGSEVLAGLENRSKTLASKLKPIDEMVSRISKNASIKEIPWENWKQEAADVAQALSTMYDEGITDTEEYVTLQYKLIKLLDAIGAQYGGVKGAEARDTADLRRMVMDSVHRETGYTIGNSNAIDALWGQGKFSIFETSTQLKTMLELAGELQNYQGMEFPGGFGAKLDKAELKRLKSTVEIIREIVNESQNKPEVGTIDHLVDSLLRLESIGAKPFNEIIKSIADGSATISSEVQDILKDLNLLNEAGQFTGNFITEGMNNSGVVTNGKYAIIARTQEHYDEPESYEYDFKDGTTYIDNLIAKEKEAADQGVNLARVLMRVKSEANTGEDLFYEIQEFAPGEQLHIFNESKKTIQDFEQECARIVGASSEHIQKLMSDLIKLNELGFYIDLSPANILYDTAEGFKFIDLSLRDVESSAQTVTELMSGLFTCLTALEDSGDRISLGSDESMRWQTAMLSVYSKLSTVFDQNNFGADLSNVMSDFYSSLSEYAGFTDNLTDANKKLTSSYEEVAEAQKEVAETSKGLSKITLGSPGETLAGTKPISFKYAVMSVEDLIMSHDAYGNVNPNYPEELQPRDRNRVASQTQILQMVKNLIPELLTASPTAQNGSPIVSGDGIVVGGNARSAALSKAYMSGLADGYKSYITEHASEFGLDPNSMPNNPVLVRVVDIDGGLDVLAKQLNESTTAGYSTTEQALINEELVMKVISKLNIDESANLNSEANKDFVKSFIGLLSDSQKNEMMTKDGSLSAIGLVKVKQALVGAAYGSREMLENLEQVAPELLNISNALTAGAAKAANIRHAVESGNLRDLGVISTLLNGVDLLKTSRHKDQNIDDYLNQLSLFGSEYSAEDIAIGKFLEANVRNATQLKNMIDIILDFAMNAGDPNQLSFGGFGEDTLTSVVRNAFAQYAEQYEKNIDYDALTSGYSPAEIGSRSDKRVDRTAIVNNAIESTKEENKLLEDFNKKAEEVYGELRKHMPVWDASEMVGDITSSVNENVISVEEGFKQLEDRYASWSAKHEKLSQKTSEASNNIRIFNDAIKNQLQGVAGNSDAIKEYSKMLSEISSGAISAADAVSHMQKKLSAYDAAPSDVSFVPYRIDKQQAESIIDSKVDRQAIEKWYLSKADHSARDELGQLAMSDDELRNATLNLLFDAYSANGGQLSFDDFVNSDTTIYRGTSKQNENQSADGKFISFTLDKNVAEQFASNIVNGVSDGMVVAIGTKIKDVVGSFSDSLSKEMELFVPRDKLDNALLSGESKESAVVNESLEAKQKQSEVTNQIVEQTKNQIDAENKLADAANNVADVKERQAEVVNNISKKQSDNKTKTTINALSDIAMNEGDEDVVETIADLASDSARMIDVISSAAGKSAATKFLEGITGETDLKERISGYFNEVFNSDDWQFKEGKGAFTVKGNTFVANLVNSSQDALQAVFQLDDGVLKLQDDMVKLSKANIVDVFNLDTARQEASVLLRDLKAQLGGRAYDGMPGLESLFDDIIDEKSFNTFMQRAKIGKQEVAALKKEYANSSSSLNDFSRATDTMRNAETSIETMRMQLDRLGEVDGVDKAKASLLEMTEAAKAFNSTTSEAGQKDAYNQYNRSKSDFEAHFKYAQEAKKTSEAEAKQVSAQDQQIQQYYQQILSTVNKINALDIDIEKAKKKNINGAFTEYINKTQEEKGRLISTVKATLSEVGSLFGDGIMGTPQNVDGARFFSDTDTANLNAFLNNAQVQYALAQGDVNKLNECINQLNVSFNNSSRIGAEAAQRIRESFQKVNDVAKNIFTFNENGIIMGSNGIDENNDSYKGVLNAYQMLQLYRSNLSGSEADWTAQEAAGVRILTEEFLKLATQLDSVRQKQAQYFANKSEYISGTEVVQSDAQIKAIESQQQAYDILKTKADEFAKASGANGAMVTNFVQSADGISRLDFSILDQGTLAVKKFSMELGSLNLNKTFLTDMNANAFTSTFQSANKQLELMGELMQRLQMSGANMNHSSIVTMVESMAKLEEELLKGKSASMTSLSTLTKEAKMSMAEVEKLYSQMTKMQQSIFSKDALDLGKINMNGDVYSQMTAQIADFAMQQPNATVAVGKFNEATRTLGFTLTDTGGQVREFRASVDALTETMTAQQVGVGRTASIWSQLGTELSSVGRMIKYATVGYYSMSFQIIRWAREGISAVKEIDAALTELKKVTDETDESYKNFLQDASKTSSQIGSKVSDFTEATSNFARLGYTMSESADMAKTAIVYKNVADGIDNVEASTDSIISTMKAFGIETNDTMSIADRFNAVGNNFAITSAGIGEALQRSAAALAEGGNTIDESIALITAAM